jgi:hypothetical protein
VHKTFIYIYIYIIHISCFQLAVPVANAPEVFKRLMDHPDVAPAGLGARDSLRLEAGLCLHGNDIDQNTTVVEAGLLWTVSQRRREQGGFPGFDVLKAQVRATSHMNKLLFSSEIDTFSLHRLLMAFSGSELDFKFMAPLLVVSILFLLLASMSCFSLETYACESLSSHKNPERCG